MLMLPGETDQTKKRLSLFYATKASKMEVLI